VRHVIELLAAKSIAITTAYIVVWLKYTQPTGMGTHEIMKFVIVEK
jgi:hypothetical protein